MKKIIVAIAIVLLRAVIVDAMGQTADSLSAVGIFYNDTVARSVIVAPRSLPADLSQPGFVRIDGNALNGACAALGMSDVIMEIRRLPGVAAGGGFQPGLYVRGGTGDDNQVLLNGIPVFQYGHLGGLFSAFNTDAITSVSLYSGGIPARYGGMASAVLDIETAEGGFDRPSSSFNIGLTDGRLHVDGPLVKDRLSVSMSIRRSWLDLIILPLINGYGGEDSGEDLDLGFSFSDFNAMASYRTESSSVTAIFYCGKDPLDFKYSALDEGAEGDMGASVALRSHLYGIKLNTELFHGIYLESLAYGSVCRGIVNVSSGDDDIALKGVNSIADYGIKASITDGRLSDSRLRMGIDLSLKNLLSEMDMGHGDDMHRTYTCDYSLYLDDEWKMTESTVFCPGLRMVAYGCGTDIMGSIEPRLSLRWQMHRMASMKFSCSHSTQYLHRVATGAVDFPSYVWMPASSKVNPMRTMQLSAAAAWHVTDDVKLSSEAFYKYMTGIYDYFGEQTLIVDSAVWHELCKVGKGRGYGVEISASYSGAGLNAAASYTLSWSERHFPAVADEWFLDRHDNRHKVVLDLKWTINDHFASTVSWMFHSGNQWNYYDDSSERLISAELPSYDRLDVGLDYVRYRTDRAEKRWRISVYNLYNARNPLICTAYPSSESETGYSLNMVGNIPFLPTISYCIKF